CVSCSCGVSLTSSALSFPFDVLTRFNATGCDLLWRSAATNASASSGGIERKSRRRRARRLAAMGPISANSITQLQLVPMAIPVVPPALCHICCCGKDSVEREVADAMGEVVDCGVGRRRQKFRGQHQAVLALARLLGGRGHGGLLLFCVAVPAEQEPSPRLGER